MVMVMRKKQKVINYAYLFNKIGIISEEQREQVIQFIRKP